MLRVECTRCQRKGRYHVHKLIERYGRKGDVMKWRELLTSDCPKRDSPQLRDRCPDLPKTVEAHAYSGRKLDYDRGLPTLRLASSSARWIALGNSSTRLMRRSIPTVAS
jgi:hypothetical protein